MRVCLLAALLLAFMSPLVTADLIDPLDNTNNFNTGFNGATVVNNNDSTVSIVRNGTPTDTGIDWLRNGNSLLVLSTESFVTIVPGDDPDANTGTYSVSIQMFDSSGTFVEEAAWISQTGSIAPHSLDVATLATNSSSELFRVRLRIFGADGATFRFDSISATPEPSAFVLCFATMIPMVRVRRRRV